MQFENVHRMEAANWDFSPGYRRGWLHAGEERMSGYRGLLNALFGCWHRHLSFPRSDKALRRKSHAADQTGMYVVCLDCGEEFAYDWERMRVLGKREQHSSADHAWELN